jgi:hypothetical protein
VSSQNRISSSVTLNHWAIDGEITGAISELRAHRLRGITVSGSLCLPTGPSSRLHVVIIGNQIIQLHRRTSPGR